MLDGERRPRTVCDVLAPVLRLVAFALLALIVSVAILGVPPTLEGDQRLDLVLSLAEQIGMIGLAAMIGVRLAPRLGLRSHIARIGTRWRGREVGEALLVGVASGVIIVGVGVALTATGAKPTRVVSPSDAVHMQLADIVFRSVCGELLFRWGVMSFLATAITAARGSLGPAHRRDLAIAAVVTAAVEVVWRLPALSDGTGPIVSHIIVAAVQGLACGWMYARWSLEAGMIAHAVPQALMTAALAAGVLAARPHG